MSNLNTRPQRLLGEGMLRAAQKHPEKIALVVEGKEYTYSQLKDASLRLAAALKGRGLKTGDRVAIYMDNTWPCIVSVYGTLLAGGIFFIVNPQTKGKKLEFLLNDSEAKILLSDSHLTKNLIIATQEATCLQSIIASGSINGDKFPTSIEVEDFDTVLETSPPLTNPLPVIPLDLAAFIYTCLLYTSDAADE